MTEDCTTSIDDPASEMIGYAYAAKHMADVRYGTKLSFDESAVEQVERILAKVHTSETRSPELLCDTSLFFGAFVGEIICKLDADAQWVSAAEGGEFGVPFILLKNMKIFPYTWCFRRACNGPDNSIIQEFQKFRSELDLRSGIAAVSSPVERLRLLLSKHGLNAGPPLSPDIVHYFEVKTGFPLPVDYAEFLCTVGNGDFSFNSCTFVPLICQGDDQTIDLNLARLPFPFTKAWSWSNEYEDEDEWNEHCDEWIEKFEHGNVTIASDDGYPGSWCLVLNGPEVGTVWLQTDGELQPTLPRCNFSDWLESMLIGKDPALESV